MARLFNNNIANYIQVADGPSVDILGTALTVSAWIKPTAVGTRQVVCAKWDYDGSPLSYDFEISSGGKISWTTGNNAGSFETPVVGATTVPINTWSHIGAIKNGIGASGLKVYLSGIEDGSGTSSVTLDNIVTPVTIGVGFVVAGPGSYVFPLNAALAEVALWDSALSVPQLQQVAAGSSPLSVQVANLRGYWPLCGIQIPEQDFAQSNNAAVVGSPSYINHPLSSMCTTAPATVHEGRGAA